MSISSGVKRLTLVAYVLAAITTLALMGGYSSAPAVSVCGWVFLVAAVAFLWPFLPFHDARNKRDVVVFEQLRWEDRPAFALFASVCYVVSAKVIYGWSIQYVAPDASIFLLVFLAVLPALTTFITSLAAYAVLATLKFILDGFRQKG